MVRAFEAAFARESTVQVYPLGVRVDTAARGGRTNVLMVDGGMRFMSRAELERVQSVMLELTRQPEHGLAASMSFGTDPYPGMPGREENFALLAALDSISRSLGAGGVSAGDPAKRGGGDVSFVAHLVPGLDGLGPTGTGAHSPAETVDLLSLTLATKRAALLIYHLTHVKP
jgi:glutamate carboxypeptidase